MLKRGRAGEAERRGERKKRELAPVIMVSMEARAPKRERTDNDRRCWLDPESVDATYLSLGKVPPFPPPSLVFLLLALCLTLVSHILMSIFFG